MSPALVKAGDFDRAGMLAMLAAKGIGAEEHLIKRATAFTLADMVGVRRAEVNLAAGAFQRRSVISYSRGNIRILDRRALEAASCRCYRRIESLR